MVGRLDISKRGEAAPESIFYAPDGAPKQISDFRGRPVLLNIWATWCAPCIKEMPMLDELAVRELDRLKVLTVSQDLQGAEKVDPFFAQANFQMLEPYIDPDTSLSLAIASGLMPTTVLYDSEGREVWRMLGAMDWDGPRAAALMEDTLAGG